MTTHIKRKSKPSLSDELYKHSPIKRGIVVVKNEDKIYNNVDNDDNNDNENDNKHDDENSDGVKWRER